MLKARHRLLTLLNHATGNPVPAARVQADEELSTTMFYRLSTIFLTATLAFAQAPTPPDPATQAQMRVNMLASQLSLTDAQKASALTIFTNAYTSMQTIQ